MCNYPVWSFAAEPNVWSFQLSSELEIGAIYSIVRSTYDLCNFWAKISGAITVWKRPDVPKTLDKQVILTTLVITYIFPWPPDFQTTHVILFRIIRYIIHGRLPYSLPAILVIQISHNNANQWKPANPCIPLYTLVNPCKPLYTHTNPCKPLYTLVYPCKPLYTPVHPFKPLYTIVYPGTPL